MKITLKLPKPRNPLAVAAKQKAAGAHGAYREQRKHRRQVKQQLHLLLSGRKVKAEFDM
jgi:hypothetical protein